VAILRRSDDSIQENPSDDSNDDVCQNLSPEHVDVSTSQRIPISSSLLPCLPNSKQAKTKGEPHSYGSNLDITGSRRHIEQRSGTKSKKE
jgi:hypothetical protein